MSKTALTIMFIGFFIGLLPFKSVAQTQKLKGRVLDADTRFPLIGATVRIADTTQNLGAATDTEGYFSIDNVPLGRQTLVVNYLGYQSRQIPDVQVTAGKQPFVNIFLQEQVITSAEVVVTAQSNSQNVLTNFRTPRIKT